MPKGGFHRIPPTWANVNDSTSHHYAVGIQERHRRSDSATDGGCRFGERTLRKKIAFPSTSDDGTTVGGHFVASEPQVLSVEAHSRPDRFQVTHASTRTPQMLRTRGWHVCNLARHMASAAQDSAVDDDPSSDSGTYGNHERTRDT
jgi:hypothetical protein